MDARQLAPSTRALSINSVGRVRMNWRIRNMAQTPPDSPGKIIAQ